MRAVRVLGPRASSPAALAITRYDKARPDDAELGMLGDRPPRHARRPRDRADRGDDRPACQRGRAAT